MPRPDQTFIGLQAPEAALLPVEEPASLRERRAIPRPLDRRDRLLVGLRRAIPVLKTLFGQSHPDRQLRLGELLQRLLVVSSQQVVTAPLSGPGLLAQPLQEDPRVR